jgi:hypothetical protein
MPTSCRHAYATDDDAAAAALSFSLDDREIITEMRYNSDIKNSLFRFSNFSFSRAFSFRF